MIVIGPAAMPSAGAIVTFPTAVPALVVATGEAVGVAVAVLAAFEDRAGAVDDEAPAEAEAEADADADEAAAADAGADASEDRDEADANPVGADEDWLAEQPATARAARTAQTVATLTLNGRATESPGAHGYRADVGLRVTVGNSR